MTQQISESDEEEVRFVSLEGSVVFDSGNPTERAKFERLLYFTSGTEDLDHLLAWFNHYAATPEIGATLAGYDEWSRIASLLKQGRYIVNRYDSETLKSHLKTIRMEIEKLKTKLEAEVDLERSERNRKNAKGARDNEMYAEIVRLGRIAAFDNSSHEVTGIVHRWIRGRRSEKTVRTVLQENGIVKKR